MATVWQLKRQVAVPETREVLLLVLVVVPRQPHPNTLVCKYPGDDGPAMVEHGSLDPN
jgi:hypothetical protein